MSTSVERYVFFNHAADREGVRRAGILAAALGARVVELLPRAILLDVDVGQVPELAATLTHWQFTPDRRQARERRLTPATRSMAASPALAAV